MSNQAQPKIDGENEGEKAAKRARIAEDNEPVEAEPTNPQWHDAAIAAMAEATPKHDDAQLKNDSVAAGSAVSHSPPMAGNRTSLVRPSYETIKAHPTDPKHFNEYLFALISFKAQHGNFSVHKEECPNLYAWLSHMKREYSRFTHHPNTATITKEQKAVLEFLHVPLTHRGDDHWNRFFAMLESYKERHGHVLVPRVCEVPGLGDWVTDQRRQYKAWKLAKPTQLTQDRRERLEKLGFKWQVRSRPEWDQRFAELEEYKKKFGDCKVPQHYQGNKALGKWVAKQREQYKLKQKGQHSFLTPDREEKLNSIDFVWQVRLGLADEDGGRASTGSAAAPTPAEESKEGPPAASEEQGNTAHDPLSTAKFDV